MNFRQSFHNKISLITKYRKGNLEKILQWLPDPQCIYGKWWEYSLTNWKSMNRGIQFDIESHLSRPSLARTPSEEHSPISLFDSVSHISLYSSNHPKILSPKSKRTNIKICNKTSETEDTSKANNKSTTSRWKLKENKTEIAEIYVYKSINKHKGSRIRLGT